MMESIVKIRQGCPRQLTLFFPKTKNQLCIIHQVQSSCKFVPYKDRKAVCADLKKIYAAVNLDDAEYAREEFREKWDRKYPNILKSWDKNWAELTSFAVYISNGITWLTNTLLFRSCALPHGLDRRRPEHFPASE